MAESIISDVVSAIIKKLGSGAYKKFKFAKDLDSHLEKLRDLKIQAEAKLRDAQTFDSCTNAQQYVIDKLSCALVELDDFLDAAQLRAEQKEVMHGNKFIKALRLFFSKHNQLFVSLKQADELKAIMEKFYSIEKYNASQLVMVPSANQRRSSSSILTTTSHVLNNDLVVGRDRDRDNIVRLLSDDSERLSVASIVGGCGLGKTTLAWYVYNDESLKACFDVQFWVSIGPKFDVLNVLERIISYNDRDEKLVDCHIEHLYHQFKVAIHGKKFLLVLDDVWHEDRLMDSWVRLSSLLSEFGASGSKVVITTREPHVAESMGSVKPYELQTLTKGDSWRLFQRIALNQKHEPGLEKIGKQIAEMCYRTPIVIWNVAVPLANKKHTIQEWQKFQADLQFRNITTPYGPGILPSLKLIYDQLDDKLKQCVHVFALFPKHFRFPPENMIHLWIALGYIEPKDSSQSLEDAGEEYVLSLYSRGILHFVYVSNQRRLIFINFVMHDLVVWIVGCKYKMANATTREFDERTRHLSLIFWETQHAVWHVSPSMFKLKSLQSFILAYIHRIKLEVMACSIPHKLSEFPCLRVLDLQGTGLEILPKSIGELTKLRYIDLTDNPIRKLPNSFRYLTNLLVLNLSDCKDFQEFPKGLCKLEKLRHLKLIGCGRLASMPLKFGNLTDLQTLSLFVAGEQSSDVVGSLAELEHLNNLRVSLEIKVLGRSTAMEARAAKLERKENLEKVRLTFINSTKDDETVLENLQPNSNLRELVIDGYAGERLPSWMMNELHVRLPNLTSLSLTSCNGYKYLCCFGRLPLLEKLEVYCLENLEYIEDIASNNGGTDITVCEPMYPHLKSLVIGGVPKLKGWWRTLSSQRQHHQVLNNQLPKFSLFDCKLTPQVDQMVQLENLFKVFQDFSSPRVLRISYANNLEAIPHVIGNFTSLEEIWIVECPNLKYLPPQLSNLTNLKLLSIEGCAKEFERRCSEQGDDWIYIRHIPRIEVSSTHKPM